MATRNQETERVLTRRILHHERRPASRRRRPSTRSADGTTPGDEIPFEEEDESPFVGLLKVEAA